MSYAAASELAGLPGMPTSAFRVRTAAGRLGIPNRRREGRGGGWEYLVDALPAETRLAWAARQVGDASNDGERVLEPAASLAQSRARGTATAHVTGWQKERQDAIARVLLLFQRFWQQFGGALTPAFHAFVLGWNQGRIEADPDIRARFTNISWSTLRSWYLAVQTDGLAGITPPENYRKGQYAALAGEIGNAVLSLLVAKPHLTAAAIYKVVSSQFGDQVPTERAFRRALAAWKSKNAQLFTAVTNPDAWRNKFMSAAGYADEGINAPNQLWQVDSTPGDVLLADGQRHNVIAVIDVFTRRRMFLVAHTSTSAGIMSLVRRAITAWGVPQTIKSDNGHDYVAKQFDAALLGLGIQHVLCPPFTPQAKPHVERCIGALMHEHFELLEGYIGHSVADRKDIEARRAFSERLFDKEEKLELRLTTQQLQAGIDAYCDRLHDTPRDELKGKTPNQRAAGFVPTTIPERALDVLLAPSAGSGLRTIGKKGIKMSGGFYNHSFLGGMEGQQVQVKVDAANLGRAWVFDLDGAFICEALDYERLGINSQEVAAARRAHQMRAMKLAKRELKAATREFDTRAAIAAVASAKTEEAVAASHNVVTLTPRTAPVQSTASIDSIEAARVEPVSEDRIAAAQAALANAQQRAPVLAIADTPEQRYARWLKLQDRVTRHEALAAEERNWFEGYAHTPEWDSMRRFFEITGLSADQVLAG